MLEEYKDRVKKFRLTENDRLKRVKKSEMQLKIFLKQNQKNFHIDFVDDDEEAKERRS